MDLQSDLYPESTSSSYDIPTSEIAETTLNQNYSEEDDDDNESANDSDSDSIGNLKQHPRYSKRTSLYSNENLDEDDEEFSETSIDPNNPALTKYFLDRLCQVIEFLGGSKESLKAFEVNVRVNVSGPCKGLLEVSYFNLRGRRSQSRVEVAGDLCLLPHPRSLRTMSREQLYLLAMETRERHLISQLLGVTGGKCDSVQFINDVLSIVISQKHLSPDLPSPLPQIVLQNLLPHPEGSLMMLSSSPLVQCDGSASLSPSPKKSLYFSFGNITVLDWGQISQAPSFHTQTQIFPLGFRCLRQEHDVLLDRVVDCLCEISATKETGSGGSIGIFPLFRLTVGWVLPETQESGSNVERVVSRVYEARSAQQVWQAAMLETLGLSSSSTPCDTSPSTEMEDMDEEELTLRKDIRELRRSYFRALRSEQSLGLQAAVKPRLLIDSVESFFDEGILRLIEGMSGAILCENYQFLGSRDCFDRLSVPDPLIPSYQAMERKAAMLCRAKGLDFPEPDDLDEEYDPLRENKRSRTPHSESKKRIRVEPKHPKAFVQAYQKIRVKGIRKVETQITALRNSLVKSLKKKREESRQKVEHLFHLEEIKLGSRLPVLMSERLLLSALPSLPIRHSSHRPPHPLSSSDPCSALPLSSSPPLSSVCLGSVLEIWDLMNCHPCLLSAPPSSMKQSFSFLESSLSFEAFLSLFMRLDDNVLPLLSLSPRLVHSLDWLDVPSSLLSPADQSLPHPPFPWIGRLPTEEQAVAALSAAAVALTLPLQKEYEKLMGIEPDPSSEPCRVPINPLTWREVARVCLLGSLCKELGMGEVELMSTVKGKGHMIPPDTNDRKLLRLARKRIISSFSLRGEFSEAVIGFGAGLIVRIPVPGPSRPSRSWDELLLWGISHSNDSDGKKFFSILLSAASLLSMSELTDRQKIKRELLTLSSQPFLSPTDCKHSKVHSLCLLRTLNPDLLLQSCPNIQLPSSLVDTTGSSFIFPENLDEYLLLLPLLLSSPQLSLPSGSQFFSSLPSHQQSLASSSAQLLPPSLLEIKPQSPSEPSSEHDSNPELNPRSSLKLEDSDSSEGHHLPLSLQRCLLVVQELMSLSISTYFSFPVDPLNVPHYYSSISQPLSLSDIKRGLLEGLYLDPSLPDGGKPLTRFYSDVRLLLDNALSYNSETSSVHGAALKLSVLFERLFLEMVLNFENPLPFKEACQVCRTSSTDPPLSSSPSSSGLKYTTCDRCDGFVHLSCLDPPLTALPRSEWFCPCCTEQGGAGTSLAILHPNRSTRVRHPRLTISSSSSHSRPLVGEVTGLEQSRGSLLFVITFESDPRASGGQTGQKELWTGEKVRRFAIDSSTSEPTHSPSPSLPSGYFFDDIDSVCGLARGYGGWGGGYSILTPFLNPTHSVHATKRSLVDRSFFRSGVSVGLLSAGWGWGGCGWGVGLEMGDEQTGSVAGELRADDWAMILRCLAQRTALTPPIQTSLLRLEESKDKHLKAAVQRIRWGSGTWRNLLSFPPKDTNQINDPIVPSLVTSLPPPSTATVGKEEWDWDHRRNSRRRGREDALLSLQLVSTVVNDIDLEGLKEEEELGAGVELEINKELGPFYPAVVNTVAKHCIMRPGEQQQLKEWSKGWRSKIKKSNHLRACIAGVKSVRDEKARLCAYCGTDEVHLGSQMVRGQSWGQWEEEVSRDTQRIRLLSPPSTLCEAISHTDHPLPPWSYLASLTMSGSVLSSPSLQVGIGLGLAFGSSSLANIASGSGPSSTTRKTGGLDQTDRFWMPEENSDREEERLAAIERLSLTVQPYLHGQSHFNSSSLNLDLAFHFPSGAVVVHEVCAEGMSMYRQALLNKALRGAESRLAECLVSQGRGRSRPLGRDSLGNLYWVPAFAPVVLVYSPPSPSCSNSWLESELSRSAALVTSQKIRGDDVFFNPWALLDQEEGEEEGEGEDIEYESSLKKDKSKGEGWDSQGRIKASLEASLLDGGGEWRVLRTDQEISSLIQWLSPSLPTPTNLSSQSLIAELLFCPSPSLPPSPLLLPDDTRLCGLLCLLFPSAHKLSLQPPPSSSRTSTYPFPFQPPLPSTSVPSSSPLQPLSVQSSQSQGQEGQTLDMEEAVKGEMGELLEEKEVGDVKEEEEKEEDFDVPSRSPFSRRRQHQPLDQVDSDSEDQSKLRRICLGERVLVRDLYQRWEEEEEADPESPGLSFEGRVVQVALRRGGWGLEAEEELIVSESDSVEAREGDRVYYRVKLDHWAGREGEDGWFPSQYVKELKWIRSRVSQRRTEREAFLFNRVSSPPALLATLFASQYLDAPNRACLSGHPALCPAPLTFSSALLSAPLECLRAGLLILEAALPLGAMDESDEKWGTLSVPLTEADGLELWMSDRCEEEIQIPFSVAWREAVNLSPDPVSLMQCLLVLEFSIRSAWIKPSGSRLLSSLPSRSYCLRNASVGLLAVKLWVLDQAILYDKVGEEKPNSKNKQSKSKTSNAGRKKK